MGAYIFPLIKSDFHFKPLSLFPGVFLIDLSDKKLWRDEEYPMVNDVAGLMIIPDKVSRVKSKGFGIRLKRNPPDIERLFDWINIFLFLKTKKNFSYDKVAVVDISEKKFLKGELSLEIFTDSSEIATIIEFSNFMFGTNRNNEFTRKDYASLKKNVSIIKKYYWLVHVQIDGRKLDEPLAVATNNFVACFANSMQDDTKLILCVTVLESLFSTSRTELRFRLAHNIAWFLHPEHSEYKKRMQVVKTVKAIYDARSTLIHGGSKEVKPEIYDLVLEMVIEIFEKILESESLTSIFYNKPKHKSFIQNLEVGQFC